MSEIKYLSEATPTLAKMADLIDDQIARAEEVLAEVPEWANRHPKVLEVRETLEDLEQLKVDLERVQGGMSDLKLKALEFQADILKATV